MKFETLLLEIKKEVAIVSISRPHVLNALNEQAYHEIFQMFLDLWLNSDVMAVILTGDGEKAFIAGTDIASMQQFSPNQAYLFARIINKTCDLVDNYSKPVIAAINGYALGGGLELALCADTRIAVEKAMMGQPEINLGIIPGSGGTQRLPRLIGMTRAKEMIMTGKVIDAKKALDWKLVDQVVPNPSLLEAALESAEYLIDCWR